MRSLCPLLFSLAVTSLGCGDDAAGGGETEGSSTAGASSSGGGSPGSSSGDAGPGSTGSTSGTSASSSTGHVPEGSTSSSTGALETGSTTSGAGRPNLSPGCRDRSRVPVGLLEDQSVTVGGQSRTYDAFVPDNYDSANPVAVVFTYHGVGGTSNTNRFDFDELSVEHGGTSIQIAPQGWGTAQWPENHFVPFTFADGLEVFDLALEAIAETYCVDLDRVFAMGHSNGGQMAFHLGCLRGDRLRAVMPSGGRCFSSGPGVCDLFNPPNAQQCVGEVMVLSVMGEDDVTRHADEEATLEGFRQRQGCDATTEPRDPEPCVRFTGCQDDAEVARCRIPGLAHAIWNDGNAGLYAYMMAL